MEKKYLLEISKISRSFGGIHAVKDVTFNVEKGVIKAIIGPNGAGKTTLFNIISGKLEADFGTISFNSRKITGLKPYVIARHGIACTFQATRLFAHMTVLENVMIGRHARTKAGFLSCLLNLPWTWKEEKQIKEKAMEFLTKLGLEGLADEDALNLSFGKQRLVEFARALATEPELLLLDEPAAGLNIYETNKLSELIMKIRGQGITILIVEHDMSLIMDISDSIVVINNGEKFAEGTPVEIQKNPEVIKVYLGEEDAKDS
jgi:branched-chain amino acid transport system ATP-binding protein